MPRSGIAAVDRSSGFREPPLSLTEDMQRGGGRVNSNPHVPKRLSRIETIFAGAISRDGCLAVRQSTEHDGPVLIDLSPGTDNRTFEWTAWHDGQ